MYIVLEIENHPDRIITDSYGPFTTRDEAETFATNQEVCNYCRHYNYRIMELTTPKVGE
jgi:hypothetical protein